MSFDVIGRPQSRRIFFVDDELRRRHFLSCKFIYITFMQILLQSGVALMQQKLSKSYSSMGQLFSIARQGRWYLKLLQVSRSGTIFMTKQGQVLQSMATFYYKVGQVLKYRTIITKQDSAGGKQEKRGRTIDFANLLLVSLVTDNLLLGILEITPPSQVYLRSAANKDRPTVIHR